MMPGELSLIALSSVASGATSAVIFVSALVSGGIGVITVAANVWIARKARLVETNQPRVDQLALTLRDRELRTVAVVEAAELVRTRCWELERICRSLGAKHPTVLERERLDACAQSLTDGWSAVGKAWAALRVHLNDTQCDRLGSLRIACAESLDDVMVGVALLIRTGRPDEVRLGETSGVLYEDLDGFVRATTAVRMSWMSER